MKLTTDELTKLRIEVATAAKWSFCPTDLGDFATSPNGELCQGIPNFPTDENDAKLLRETLAAEGWNCTTESYTDGTHHVSFWKDTVIKKDEEHSAHADTLPVAICLAFLKVKRSK